MRNSGDRRDRPQGGGGGGYDNRYNNNRGQYENRRQGGGQTHASAAGGAREDSSNRRPNIQFGRNDAPSKPLASSTVARAKGALLQDAIAPEEYGTVISLRPGFGFIQNAHSDDQIYFSEQDVYASMKVGDFVAFTALHNAKGLQASKIKHLPDDLTNEEVATNVLGTILRIPERHRSNCGLVEIELSSVPTESHSLFRRKPVNVISYRMKDIAASQIPRGVLLDKGDFIEFSICKVSSTNWFVATNIKLKQLRRDREREKAIAQQIQRMLDAGAVREIGVVTAIKNKEYGFIKGQDRKDELYFRMDGFLDDNASTIKEGTEVEFFAVAEMVRGKLSDRAMHLRVIPSGTVEFETVVQRDALVTVVTEPQQDEAPGVGVLQQPVTAAAIKKDPINDVEVWQRCLPDEMVCKRGDILKVNVHYYRPEKLFFIRSVRLVDPFLLGRDKGTVCSIKESAGFGFISSDSRKTDLYFRLNQVVAASGEMLKKNEVVEGLRVSFDVVIESEKLRAVRVKAISFESSANEGDETPSLTRIPISANLYGKVVRSTTPKKESVGLIQLSPANWKEIQEFEYIDPDLRKSLSDFAGKVFLQEVTIPAISNGLRKQLCAIMDKDFLDLAYEVVDGEIIDGVLQRSLRITKLYGAKRTAAPSQQQNNLKNGKDIVSRDGYTLSYVREDYVTADSFGPLGNDMEVVFDVVWDVVKGKRVATNIRLTDEAVQESTEEQVGIIDVLMEKGDKFGFIRCIPSWEKLFWHVTSVDATHAAGLKLGSLVSFVLRRRGGMRCATNVRVLTDASSPLYRRVADEETIASTEQQRLLAAVVAPDQAILLDVESVASLKDKMLSLSQMGKLSMEVDAQGKSWEKGVKVAGGGGKDTPVVAEVVQSTATASSSSASPLPPSEQNASPIPDVVGTSPLSELASPLAVLHDGPMSESGSVSTGNSNRVEYAAKYFGQINREPVLIRNAPTTDDASSPAGSEENATSSTLYKVGDIVEVSVTLNWTLAQPITSVTVLNVVGEVLGGVVHRKGTITKVKHRFKNAPHVSNFYHFNAIDFVEITELEEIPISEKDSALAAAAAPPPNASTTGNVVPTKQKINYLLSVQNDIRVAAANSSNNNNSNNNIHHQATTVNVGDAVAVGDDVEFCVVPMFPNIALHVRRSAQAAKVHELLFQSGRQGINDKLKEMKSKVGTTNVVSMAAGPPSDSAKGFEPGWRRIDDAQLASLPWAATLLTHLLPKSLPVPSLPVVVATPPLPPSPPTISTTSTTSTTTMAIATSDVNASEQQSNDAPSEATPSAES